MDADANAREVRLYRKFAVSILAFCMIAALVATIAGLACAQYPSAFVALLCGAFLALAMRTWAITPTAVAWGTADAAGITIRVDKRLERLTLACYGTGSVGLGAVGILGGLGELAIPIPLSVERTYAFMFGSAAVVLLAGLVVALRRPGMSFIRIAPDGFTFTEAFSSKQGDWSDVVDITNDAPPKSKSIAPIVFVMRSGKPKVLKYAQLFTPDGRVLLDYIRFYWQKTEFRVELTDERALQRLRTAQQADQPPVS